MGRPPSQKEFTQLRDTLIWVDDRSRSYRRLFADAGVRPAELRSYDDSRTRVPRTDKTRRTENHRTHPPFGESLAAKREEFASLHGSRRASPGRW